jgi:hypothetical protein
LACLVYPGARCRRGGGDDCGPGAAGFWVQKPALPPAEAMHCSRVAK